MRKFGVAHLVGGHGDLIGRRGRRGAGRAKREAPPVAFGQRLVGLGGVHHPARGIVLLDGAARVGADLHDEDVADRSFGADARSGERSDAERVGLGQFGQVAGAHQHLDLAASCDESAR